VSDIKNKTKKTLFELKQYFSIWHSIWHWQIGRHFAKSFCCCRL